MQLKPRYNKSFLGLGTRTQLAMYLFPEEVNSDVNT